MPAAMKSGAATCLATSRARCDSQPARYRFLRILCTVASLYVTPGDGSCRNMSVPKPPPYVQQTNCWHQHAIKAIKGWLPTRFCISSTPTCSFQPRQASRACVRGSRSATDACVWQRRKSYIDHVGKHYISAAEGRRSHAEQASKRGAAMMMPHHK